MGLRRGDVSRDRKFGERGDCGWNVLYKRGINFLKGCRTRYRDFKLDHIEGVYQSRTRPCCRQGRVKISGKSLERETPLRETV